ncbi:MAG: hypothetical protein AMXMBFR46_18910 [Acidimicrobiia bacterium]
MIDHVTRAADDLHVLRNLIVHETSMRRVKGALRRRRRGDARPSLCGGFSSPPGGARQPSRASLSRAPIGTDWDELHAALSAA